MLQPQLSVEPQQSELANHVDGARYAATGSIPARHVSGIVKQLRVIIQSPGSVKYHREGKSTSLPGSISKLTGHFLRSVEKISQTLQEYRAILQKLFPNVHPDQLAGMSREKLIDLISKTGPFQAPSPVTPGQEDKQLGTYADSSTLEQLQPLPEEADGAFRPKNRARTFSAISEDVDALFLTGKESSSYLGISSVMAVLRVILWLDPECQRFVAPATDAGSGFKRENSGTPSILELPSSATPLGEPNPSTWSEPAVINAYFQYVHPATPLIDEQTFRDLYISGDRTDSRWLLLLNSVLAVGSIATSNSASSATHEYYFTLAREQLTVDVLGSAHIETVQALALLSGYYLHYVQEPNLASAIMGATLRMATMLGLHRDFSEGLGPAPERANISKASSSIEMRRRIWWSIFMLDTWAGSTLGRPSMGRMSQAVTSRAPSEAIGDSEIGLQLVQESIRFCQISTRLEDNLAVSPTMDDLERQSLDACLVDWYRQSSVISQQVEPSTAQYHSPHSTTSSLQNQIENPGMTLTRNLMRWRYLLNRIILHRPALLWWAMRSHRQSASTKSAKTPALDPARRTAIEVCRTVTAELITDICANWTTPSLPPSTMSAWQATSLLYQAVMVPLLSLFSDPHDEAVTHQSRQLIDISIDALEEMQKWCKIAKRSLEVVSALYAASRRHSPHSQAVMTQIPQDEILLTDQTDEIVDHMGLDAFGGSSASVSVSGGIGSGGLGTPATLPSSVSTSSRHHHIHRQQQQQSHIHYQPQAVAFTQPHHQRPTYIDLPPLSVSSIFPQPLQQLPSQYHQQVHHQYSTTPARRSTSSNFMHPHPAIATTTTPSVSSTSANSNSAYLESSTTNLLDSLTWSQGWTDTNYPFETPRLGWDPCAMHGWVGGIDSGTSEPGVGGGGDGGGGGYEYFAAAAAADGVAAQGVGGDGGRR